MAIYSLFKAMLQKIKKKQYNHTPKLDETSRDSLLFSININESEEMLKKQLGITEDIVFHSFQISVHNKDRTIKALLVSVEGLINEEVIYNQILKQLSEKFIEGPLDTLLQIKEQISVNKVTLEDNLEKAVYKLLKGQTLLLIDGYKEALLIHALGYEGRSIEEPQSEQVVRGARDGFVEATAMNIALLRRRISHPSLQVESVTIGEYSQTKITMLYIKGIVDLELMERLKHCLMQIKVDAIHDSGEIEQFIEEHPFSIFSTIGNTERPDKAASLLMEGRIIIFIDGSPISLYVPFLFLENIQSIEDYNSRPYYSSFIRLLRFSAFIVSITFPALYISVINFHKEIIPSDMVVPLIQARESVPFPLAMEVILMIIMFEIVREAGIRLPQQIGSALSIVGALILGQVSVSAGLVGAPTIVMVSLSYIAAFVITPIADVTALLRLILFFVSSIFGSYGLFTALLGLMTHMISLTSLGVPYMAPLAPFYFQDWKDTFIRVPLRWMKQRARSIPNNRATRIKSLPKNGDK